MMHDRNKRLHFAIALIAIIACGLVALVALRGLLIARAQLSAAGTARSVAGTLPSSVSRPVQLPKVIATKSEHGIGISLLNESELAIVLEGDFRIAITSQDKYLVLTRDDLSPWQNLCLESGRRSPVVHVALRAEEALPLSVRFEMLDQWGSYGTTQTIKGFTNEETVEELKGKRPVD